MIQHRRTSYRHPYIGSRLEGRHRTEYAFDGTGRRRERHGVSPENAPPQLVTEQAEVQTELKRRFEMDMPWFDRKPE